MDADELFAEWQNNKDRPAYVREHSEQIREHLTELKEPIPEDGSLHEVREWLNRYKGTVTRQLKPESEDADDAEVSA